MNLVGHVTPFMVRLSPRVERVSRPRFKLGITVMGGRRSDGIKRAKMVVVTNPSEAVHPITVIVIAGVQTSTRVR